MASSVSFAPTSLTFGNQNVNTTSAAQSVTLTNSGTGALTITSIVASAPYAQTNTCGASLAAGANCSISVTFTPTVTGSQPGTITVTDNATGSPQTVNLTGTGAASSVSFAPTSLAFGNQNLNTTSAAQTVTLTNSGTAALNITSIAASAPYAQTNTCGASLAAGANCSISVTFTPTVTGSLPGTITVTDNATGSPQTVNLTGTGAASSVSFAPTSLAFGNQNVNTTSAAQSVTLTNSGTGALTITSIVASAPYAQTNTCGASVAAGANCSINVTFTPTATGSLPGTITVTDNATGSPQTVNLTGTGTASSASFAPTTLAFGNQNLNTTSAAQTVTLTNSGTAALNITSIAASAPYAQTNTCPASLAAGANCSISVTFTPTAVGSLPGTISVTDNATGSPQTVTLTGSGTTVAAPAVSLSATSLTFASQQLNTTSAAQTVTLTNSGTALLNLTSILPSGDYAQTNTCGPSLAAAANCSINVSFTPTATGTRTGAITITDNATGSPHSVNLSGTGSSALTSSIKLTGKFTEALSGNTSVSSQTVTNSGFPIASGDLIVAIVRIGTSGESATSCSDNVNPGNYTQAHYQEDASNGRAMIHYYKANSAAASSGSLTITCLYPSANHAYLGALDYSGAATTNPLDGHIGTTFTAATTSPTSASITPSQSGDLLVGSVYISESSTVTVSTESTGFTKELIGKEGTGNFQHAHTADEVLSNAAAQNYKPTFSSSITTIDIMTAFKDGGSGGGSAAVSFAPTSLTFASQAVGTTSAAQTVTLSRPDLLRRVAHHREEHLPGRYAAASTVSRGTARPGTPDTHPPTAPRPRQPAPPPRSAERATRTAACTATLPSSRTDPASPRLAEMTGRSQA